MKFSFEFFRPCCRFRSSRRRRRLRYFHFSVDFVTDFYDVIGLLYISPILFYLMRANEVNYRWLECTHERFK